MRISIWKVLPAYGRDRRRVNAAWRVARGAAAFLLLATSLATSLVSTPARAEPVPVRVLALGDSLTAGYNLPHDASFAARLEAALHARGHAVRVINGGVSGDTSAGGLARLDWMLADRPQVAVVELGANDALRGLPPAAMHTNLDAILARLKAAGARVLLAGMLAPPNLGPDYGRAFNGVYPALAERHGVALYPFFLDGVAANPALLQPDGLHPTAAGVEEIVRRILPHVEPLVAAAAAEAGS